MSGDTAPETEKEPVDPALVRKAVDDLRELLRGNGLRPEDITLKDFKGEVVDFEARMVYKLETAAAEKHVPGREMGEVAGSYNDAQQKIAVAAERIARDRDVRKTTVEGLRKRPDLGFSPDPQFLRLDRFNKKFVIHSACVPCSGNGKILCRNCQGKKQIVCTRCNGRHEMTCPACRGTQFIGSGQGRQHCQRCMGRGRTGCDLCNQTGHLGCPKCRTTGKMPCQPCGATGWTSHIFLLTVKAKGMLAYDREALPGGFADILEDFGARVVTEEHGMVRIIDEPDKEEEMDRLSKQDEFVIPYQLKIPWGDIVIGIKTEDVSAKLFGFNPHLADLPPVLERAAGGGLKALAVAAAEPGRAHKAIDHALRFRITGDAVLAVLAKNQPQAAAALREIYPYGIADDTVTRLCRQAADAVRILTLKARAIAVVAGTALTLGLQTAYYLSGVRPQIAAQNIPETLADAGIAVLLATGMTFFVQAAGGMGLRRALLRIEKKAQARKIRLAPGIMDCALWSVPAALAATLAAALIAAALGSGPSWLGGVMK